MTRPEPNTSRGDARAERPAPEPIAIIGMACMFPQAPDLRTFWRNIILGVDAVGEPTAAWGAQRYLDSGRIKTASGGYLKDLFRFDPREFGIMPNSIDGGEPDQFLALRVARDALADAGYLDGHDHADTGIVLGHSTYLHRGQGAILQNTLVLDQTLDLLRAACPELDADRLGEIEALLKTKLPPSNADIAPGLVPNVMTGRIANRLNLKGPNYLVDAACSSSLLAVNAAVDELRSGRSRLMLAGGVNASLPAEVTVIFTQLGALSGRGKVRPFEAGSDGTLLGEGLGVVVLKRVTDALADGDRIYAVLRGIGQASDGRGQGLLAPSVEGETLAIRRAYDGSGVDPASVSLIEAHGTGIPLGDRTEIAALKNVFGARRTPQPAMAIGSVKSMISHCIPAAGIAGLIKTALALHHRAMPPSLCGTVNPELGISDTPFHVNTRPMPWIGRLDHVRRAGVNSFGFGGINVHAIVEEASAEASRHPDCMPWPAELCVFAAESREALIARLDAVTTRLAERPDIRLADIGAGLAAAEQSGAFRFALVARDVPALTKAVESAVKRLREDPAERWSTRGGAAFCSRPLEGRLAFVFPGEGSQYIEMLGDLALCFGEVRHWLDFWHTLYDEPRGANRTDVVFPAASELDDDRRRELEMRLHGMDVGSEAVFVAGQALHALLRSLGVEPDVMLGHSSGESAALAASRAVPGGSAELAAFIRQLNGVYERVLGEGRIPTGALLAVGALASSAVEAQIAATAPDVVVAMDNCANQLVLYGPGSSIEKLQAALTGEGAICMPLPFDRGYHTPAFADVSAAFSSFYESIGLGAPAVPLYSCATANLFPADDEAVRKLAAAQWSTTVRFRETIERMHADGVRYFIEVGPSGNLTAFVNDVLAGQERCALATNLRRRNGVEQLLSVLAELYASGRPVKVSELFAGRGLSTLGLDAPVPRPSGPVLDNTMPMLRLDARDRELVQRIVSGGSSAAPTHRSEPTAPIASAVPDPVQEQFADRGRAEDHPVQPPVDPRSSVMAGYFDLMREFLAQQHAVIEGRQPLAESTASDASGDLGELPFLDEIVERGEAHVVVRCHLSLEDEFLKSHVLSGRVSEADPGLLGLACVPLMVSLEIMAQTCCLLAGRRQLGVIENVRAFDWIALDDEVLVLDIHAEAVEGFEGLYRARIFNGDAVAATADFRFERASLLDPLQALAGGKPSRWNGSELYSTGMFHGPIFQSVGHIEAWSAEGIDAALSNAGLVGFFREGVVPSLILHPVLLDAVGQVAAYWIAQQAGTDFNCFPSTIHRIELLAPAPPGLDGLALRGRQQPLERGHDDVAAPRSWRFECIDASGEPLLRVDGLVNVYFDVPHAFYEVRRDPLRGLLGRASDAPRIRGAVLWEVPQFAEDFCAQSSGIFLRILAHALLGAEERDEWRSLTGNVRRRREWLLGRAAIKEAVRVVLHERTGCLLYPSDIVVHHDALGGPHVDGWWSTELGDPPHVSLSHTARACLVAVSDSGSPVGVDFEDIGRVGQPDLLLGALTAAEREALSGLSGTELDERLLRLWCAKEAAAKFLGVGLQGRPEGFGVQFVDTGCARAVVDFEGATIDVGIVRDGPAVIAVAQAPLGAEVS